MAIKDLTGKQFGKLIVLRDSGQRYNGSVLWRCQCDCGTITDVISVNLQSGHTRSCGCLHGNSYEDFVPGQRFGRLVLETYINGEWGCLCDCGQRTLVRPHSLATGRTKSCGCYYSRPIEERFWEKVEFSSNGCWLYLGAKKGFDYARLRDGENFVSAHRWAYERYVGPIPEGMELGHTCHDADLDCRDIRKCFHRRCVNFIEHLKPMTPSANVRAATGRSLAAINASKTECKFGHALEPNPYVPGTRWCRLCHNEVSRRHNQRKRDEAQK